MSTESLKEIVSFVRSLYGTEGFIPLHEPRFVGNERKYVNEAIDSTFVSSVGAFVDKFEQEMATFSGAEKAVATVNGTAALHIGLKLVGVQPNDLVLSQSLTFVATCNAISYCGAEPVFIDVDFDTMGMSPMALQKWLEQNSVQKGNTCVHKATGKQVSACVPMHAFGMPCRIDELVEICHQHGIKVVEDAAESIGSYYKGRHTGTFGDIGTFSFNGNKTITCGGGGAIVCNNDLGARAKHITTTAKVPHKWEYRHDEIGYNYRMPNLNAAMICAQLEQLPSFIENKRQTAEQYRAFFADSDISFVTEPENAKANYWLMAILLANKEERNSFLEHTNKSGVMTRPVWVPMDELPMFQHCLKDGLNNTRVLSNRLVNVPSSVIIR